jgi:hypothetical protein
MNEFVAAMHQQLSPHGFEKSGAKLRRPRGSEWLFIDFQRNRYSDRDHTSLWGWVGLTSDAIARFLGFRRLAKRPAAWEIAASFTHFLPELKRAPEWLIEETPDPAWDRRTHVQRRGNVLEVAEHVASVIVQRVLPEVAPFSSDEEICRLVLAGKNLCGCRLIDDFHMAILTAHFGPREAFERYAAAAIERNQWPRRFVDQLRRGELYAPGFGPAEKGDKPIKPLER